MKNLRRTGVIFVAGSLLGMILCGSAIVNGQDTDSKINIPEGVYIELTKDFYEALQGERYGGTKTYSNDPSTEYLKQISISARFMVETNLHILKQQERIIQLLHSHLKKK
ncbi:MAG: hypothetical protein JRJ02_08205 [Deltaproteobacteria bacterium]|nr:hypothetical protein [Deltaproteobacteria bacterium]MBW1862340.1 hypothetical protein [Deltaproteobacteria bacterium]